MHFEQGWAADKCEVVVPPAPTWRVCQQFGASKRLLDETFRIRTAAACTTSLKWEVI